MSKVFIAKPSEPHVYVKNMATIFKGRFTVFSELYSRLYLRLESLGYTIPHMGIDGSRIRPHKSAGPGFKQYLLERCPLDPQEITTFDFIEDNGQVDREQKTVYQYQNSLLPAFAHFYEEVWLKDFAENYFKRKDPKVIGYLSKLVHEPENDQSVAQNVNRFDSKTKVNMSITPKEQKRLMEEYRARNYEDKSKMLNNPR